MRTAVEHNKRPINVMVIVDAFRAFVTACYILEQSPIKYIYTTKSSVISRMAKNFNDTILVGKPEIGQTLIYDIPNSPTRVSNIKLNNKVVLHRTEAGAKGIIQAKADIILAASFVNAKATVEYIKRIPQPNIIINPMGHEGKTPTLEDNVCAKYIKALLENENLDIKTYIYRIKRDMEKYFSTSDQWQYPSEDLVRCLEIGRFDFTIKAKIYGDYSVLTLCK